LRSRSVWWDRSPTEVFGFTYEGGFWHLVSRYHYEWSPSGRAKRRDFDPPRAERLPWFAPVVRNADTEAVLAWDYLEANGKINTYLWLSNWDYVVVLQRRSQTRGEVYFLVTAYHVDGPGTAAKLHRKHERKST
jgi:hypothetical protein